MNLIPPINIRSTAGAIASTISSTRSRWSMPPTTAPATTPTMMTTSVTPIGPNQGLVESLSFNKSTAGGEIKMQRGYIINCIQLYMPRIVSRIITSSASTSAPASMLHPIIARAEIAPALWRTPKIRQWCNLTKYQSQQILVTHLLFEPGPYDRDSIARASSQLGSSWFDSIISSTSSFTKFRFLSLKKDVAKPRLPMRPVRPMRCTYSSTSDGRSKLMTCLTLGMSRPRAATYIWWDMLANFSEVAGFSLISKGRYLCQILTAVATSMGLLPHLNRLKASSLSFCVRSPWIEVTGKPSR